MTVNSQLPGLLPLGSKAVASDGSVPFIVVSLAVCCFPGTEPGTDTEQKSQLCSQVW